MYVHVILLNGFERPLWYKIPPHLKSDIYVGQVVHVPLQRRQETALVTAIMESLPATVTFTIKEISDVSGFPADGLYHTFVEKISQFYLLKPLYFFQRIRHYLQEQEHSDDIILSAVDKQELHQTPGVCLTDEQQAVVTYVDPIIKNPSFESILVHGVTGSGKTEVYKKLIQTALSSGKTVILLLPEVTLALQFEHLLKKQMPSICIVGFHSASKVQEKRSLWEKLLKSQPVLIIGVHLPVLLPIPNLGLIIVDEEHEQGFVEKKHPRLNSKEISLWRASHYKIPIVLGSATPSLTSLHNVGQKKWKMFRITRRFSGQFPTIQRVILTAPQQRKRRFFWISPELEAAIKDRLAKKEQIIIFLNRRGYSFFVQCKNCGFIFECPHCSVSLTLHMPHTAGPGMLRCHYCDHTKQLPLQCQSCKAPEKDLLKKGIGTQQVVRLFQEAFPQAAIERADHDTTTKKRTWQATVESFYDGHIDILIGTQSITKGYHFPNVTLVGVLWADLNLHFPVYNASETTLQQLIQVAGRAGRQRAGGHVIVQTMHDHPIFSYVDEEKYLQFARSELEERKESNYPPFVRLATIEIKNKDEQCVDSDAQKLSDVLHCFVADKKLSVTILGPALPLIRRVQNYEMRTIVLKASSFKELHEVLSVACHINLQSSVFIVVNQ